MPNSHPIAPNAKLKLRRERLSITGHHYTKCFTPIVVICLTVSFSLQLLMRRSIPAMEIHMPGKFKERGLLPFFGRGKNELPCLFSPDQRQFLLNGNPITRQVISIYRFWSRNHPYLFGSFQLLAYTV